MRTLRESLSTYLAQVFLEWEMFQMKVVEETKTRLSCLRTFFPKIMLFIR